MFELIDALEAVGDGVLHVTGWEEAFGGEDLPERVYDLNFLRESVVERPATQVWWMPVRFRDAFMLRAPDTWSVTKLRQFLADEAEYLELSPRIADIVRSYLDLPPSAPIPRRAAEELGYMDGRYNRLSASDVSSLSKLKGVWNLDLSEIRAPSLEPLSELSHLTHLDLMDADVRAWKSLRQLEALEVLELVQTDIADLSPLSKMNRLRYLDLMGTKVRNLRPIAHLPSLTYLDVSSTDVADVSILGSASRLAILNIKGTPANLKPIHSLTEALPNLLVLR